MFHRPIFFWLKDFSTSAFVFSITTLQVPSDWDTSIRTKACRVLSLIPCLNAFSTRCMMSSGAMEYELSEMFFFTETVSLSLYRILSIERYYSSTSSSVSMGILFVLLSYSINLIKSASFKITSGVLES